METLLHIENLDVGFHTAVGTVAAVNAVSLHIFPGETLALVGETGCGKSVLANAILKLLPDNATYQGQIVYQGKNLLECSEKEMAAIREQNIAIVLQNPSLALNPLYTAGHQIAEPLRVHRKMKKAPAWQRATTLLKNMKFPAPETQRQMYPFQCSGGMNQRVMIAMSVVLRPKLLIADEPTKGLDRPLQQEVVEELQTAKTLNNASLLLITHDVKLARTIADRIAIMYAGEILEIARPHDFFFRPMHPYTQAFLQSLPEHGFQPIPGSSPDMTNLPKGCPFHPRCSYKHAECTLKKPPMRNSQGRSFKCVRPS